MRLLFIYLVALALVCMLEAKIDKLDTNLLIVRSQLAEIQAKHNKLVRVVRLVANQGRYVTL